MSTNPPTPIYTIGYGSRSIDEFMAALKRYDIHWLVDVRSAPYSRYKPEFSKKALESALQQQDIRYLYMGDSLGGRPEHEACRTDGKVDYAKVTQMDFYQDGIGRIQTAFQQQRRLALMCSEGKPEMCHRALLIGASLSELNIPVVHIDEQDAAQSQEAVMARLTPASSEPEQQPSLFDDAPAPTDEPPFYDEPPPAFDDAYFTEPPPAPDWDDDHFMADMASLAAQASATFAKAPSYAGASPQELLKAIFGYDEFRAHQEQIVKNIVAKRDTLVVMPTGGGKSLCFQLPALLFDGLTVVVSPLISLMQDQVTTLADLDIPAVYLNSSLDPHTYANTVQRVRAGAVKLLYVAPETLLRPDTLNMLAQCQVDCLAIDEAHCVSQWGHDFRPEYRQLAAVRQRFPQAVCAALTATATPRVQTDIKETLQFQDENTFVASFDRPNLFISLQAKNNAPGQLLDFLAQHEEQSGIIYCATRRTVDDLTSFLHSKDISARPYHAGLDAATRQRNQNDFIRDNVRIIVATVAFGMGIDKPDVRFVLHVDLPQDMENYYQQIGRAGRDGLRADCLLLYSRGDVFTIRRFIEEGAAEEARGRSLRLEAMVRWAESDICRRRQLLDYFGETYTNDDCEMCDNCLRGEVEKVDLTVAAQKFLSCVVRTEQIFGANHIINVLRGSQAKTVLDKGHDRVSTYGIGLEHSAEQWKHLSRQFLVQGLLEQDMQFGSLKVTPAGWAVLKGEEQVWGTLAEEQSKQVAAEVMEYDAGLMTLLRTARKELADAANVPPYVVFADRSLMEMATYFPQSTASFAAIHGVGQAKIERYAPRFLPLIRDYCHKHGLTERSRLATQAPTRNSFRKSRAEEVGERFGAGESVEALMASYDVKRGTILSHLAKFVQSGETLPMDRLRAESTLSAADQERVHQQFAELGVNALRPIFEALGEQIMYDELHLLRAVYILEEKVRMG